MLNSFDTKIFYFINGACANPFLDSVMPFISMLGSGEFLFAVAVIILIISLLKKRGRMNAILLLAGLEVVYVTVHFLKSWIARPRPFVALAGVHLVSGADKSFSFPSGHAAVSFMAAVLLSRFFGHRVFFFTIAAAVLFSRIYLGVHYPSDCLGGAACGSLIGWAIAGIPRSLKN